MVTIDLGPPRPDPRDLLDGLPRRVALTLPELLHVAAAAGGAPLPFDRRRPPIHSRAGRPAAARRGRRRGAAAYAATLARLARRRTSRWPAAGCSSADAVDDGLLGAVGLLATPRFALDLDVVAGGVQAAGWHRQSGDAVAVAVDRRRAGLRARLVPDLGLGRRAEPASPSSRGPAARGLARPGLRRPAARAGRRRRRGGALPPLRPAAGAGRPPPGPGHRRDRRPAHRPRGRHRADRARQRGPGPACARWSPTCPAPSATTVGVVAWTLVADGWRALRPHTVDDRLRVEVRRVIPEDLAAELAPVLAAVTATGDRELRPAARAGRRLRPRRRRAARPRGTRCRGAARPGGHRHRRPRSRRPTRGPRRTCAPRPPASTGC